ncbi:MAG TPA: phage holin family protein [Abditibacteriaceae bacterium]
MIGFVIRIVINAVALLAIARLSDSNILVKSFLAALVVALVLGVANATVKPILYGIAKTMTCALSCLTLGLWSLALSWLINGALFWLAAQYLDGFSIRNNNFWTALWGALALSIVNALATVFTRREKDE